MSNIPAPIDSIDCPVTDTQTDNLSITKNLQYYFPIRKYFMSSFNQQMTRRDKNIDN